MPLVGTLQYRPNLSVQPRIQRCTIGRETTVRQRIALREQCDNIIAVARAAWDNGEHIGETGSLIMLGCKKILQVGMLVEPVAQELIHLQSDRGHTFSTIPQLFEVWKMAARVFGSQGHARILMVFLLMARMQLRTRRLFSIIFARVLKPS